MKTRILSTSRLSFALASAIAALLAASPAHAATLTWDANGATAGQTDGAGAWLTANLWWDGANNVSWSSGSDAIFGNGGAGGAVTLSSPTTVNSLTLNSFIGTYTLGTAAQTITLSTGLTKNSGGTAATIISPVTLGGAQSWTNNSAGLLTVGTGAVTGGANLLTIDGSGNTTISSVISGTGAGGITKIGAGTLTLSGTNTFAGQLTVQTGTLAVASVNNDNSAGRLGQSTLSVILGNPGAQTGTLQYTAATSVTGTKKFTLATGGTGVFQVDNSAAVLTLSGVLDGGGDLTKTGVGALVLSGTNTYGGATTVNGGVLRATDGTGLNTGSLLTLNGGVFETGVSFARSGGASAGNMQITGGASGFSANGGAVQVAFGPIAAPDALTWGTAPFAPDTFVLNAATANNMIDFKNPIDLGASARTIQVNANVATISGYLSGTGGGLTKTGAGILALTGTNSYTGITTVSAGVLQPATPASLPGYDSPANVVFSGGTQGVSVDGAGWTTAQVDTLLSNATKTSGTLGLDTTTSGDLTQWTAFTPTNLGPLGLNKLGSNALILNQANTYTGATIVGAGTLQLTDPNAIASSSGLTLASGSTLALRSDTAATFNTPTTTIPVGATVTIDVNNNSSGSGNALTLGTVTATPPPSINTQQINVTGGNGYTLRIPTLNWIGPVGNPTKLTLNSTSASVVVDQFNYSFGTGSQQLILDGTTTGNVIGNITSATWLVLTKQGTGTWTWNANTSTTPMGNNSTGISSGTLIVNGSLYFQNGRFFTMTGGTLCLNSTNAIGDASAAATALVINGGNLDNTSGAPITLSTSNPVMTWGGNFTFLGSTGATSDLNLGTGAMTMAATRQVTVTNAAATLTVGGVISGAGGLTKAGPGMLKLSGANAYTGVTTIQAGVLVAGANSAVSANGAFGKASTAIVLGNGSTAAGDAPAVLISGAFTVGRDITVGSVANTAAYNATIGGSNTTGTSTYTGNITLNTTAANYTATLQAATGGSVEFSTGTWTTNDKAIAIGSPGNTGTVMLSNAIATTGGINVNYGTLALNSAFTGDLTVASGATLAGTGTISGLVTAAGRIAPGSSIGTMNVGSLTLNSATLDLEFNGGGTSYDKVIVANSGGLTINGGTLNIVNTSGGQWAPVAGIYDLISYQGTLTGSASSLTVGNPVPNYTYTVGTEHPGWITVNVQSVQTAQEWAGNNNNQWDTGANWEGGSAPGAYPLTVNFGKISSSGMVNLNSQTPTLAVTKFRSAVSTAISGPGSITLNNGGSGAIVTVDTGNSHSIGSGVSVVLADNALISTSGGLTIAGLITESGGARSITKEGAGTLTLSGANSYTGGVSLNAGWLVAGSDTALGTPESALNFNGGTLQTASDRMLANAVTIATAGAYVDTVSNTLTMSGIISGSGALTKAGTGTLTLSGANTYGGVTTLTAGQLILANANAVQNSTVDVGTLNNALGFSGGTSFTLGGLQGSGGQSIEGVGISVGNNNANTTYSGALTGAGSLTKSGTGTLTLTGANTHSGGTTLSAGILNASADNQLGDSGGTLAFNGGTLRFGGSFSVGISRNVTITSSGYVDSNGNTGTIDSAMGGVGGLTKVGTGTLILNQTNNYTGATAVVGGTLQLTNPNAIASSSNLTITNGGTLALRGDTAATFTTPGNGTTSVASFLPGTSTVTIDVNNMSGGSDNTLVMSGGVGFNAAAGTVYNSTLTITGGNGYVLRTPISVGRADGSVQALTLNPTSASIIVDGLRQGFQVGGNIAVILGGAGTTSNEVTGTATDVQWLVVNKNTAATWTWNVDASAGLGDTTISAGNFIITGTIRNQNTRPLVLSGGTLHFNSGSAVGSNWTISGGNIDNTSGVPITSTGNPLMQWNGNFTFLGSNGADSDLDLGTGAVALGGSTRQVTVQNVATTLTVGGVISGAGGLIKAGDGTLNLSGANAYAGPTTIYAGTLALGASNVLASTAAVAIANATLDATTFTTTAGTLDATGNATINLGDGAALAFADSSAVDWTGGTLNLTGTFVPGASLRFGTTNSGLTPDQLALISAPGFGSFTLDADGFLTVGSASPYAIWSGGAAFDADTNNDGVKNGLAWLLGAANKNADATGLLPKVSDNAGGLVLTFDCLSAANRGAAVLNVQHSSDIGQLDPWAAALVPGTAPVSVTVGGVDFVTTANGALIHVVATIPAGNAAAGKLFGRLKATEN